MLTLFRSPIPSVLQAGPSLPEDLVRVLERMRERPEKFAWIVPTGRRKRALVHHWLAITGSKSELPLVKTEPRRPTSEPRPLGRGEASPVAHAPGPDRLSSRAAILPRFFTLESFVAEALEYGLRQKPRISGPERLLRLAAIWHEMTGRSAGPGVIHQIDRYVRDCQACGVKPSATSVDRFDQLVNRYDEDLRASDRLDRMSAVAALVEEVADPEGWPNRIFLKRIESVLIDGFHRFEPVELDLIAALGKVCEIYLWMVGIPDTPSWQTVEAASTYLKGQGGPISIVDWGLQDSVPATPFAHVGRRIFQNEQMPLLARRGPEQSPPGLLQFEADGPIEEVEAVARQIKADYLHSKESEHPLRLSDVAVIIPGPAYDPLIREVFPRAGLEFNLAGRALLMSASRPARVLLAAIKLIQGRWRYDLLLDFLHQPMVLRRLDDAHRLEDLFEYRPRARQQMNHEDWSKSWKRHLDRLKKNIDAWQAGTLELPERNTLSLEDFVAKQGDLAASLQRLIESVEVILNPIKALARAIEDPPSEKPLGELVQALLQLLDELKIDEWLRPQLSDLNTRDTSPRASGPVLWVEYEKDQNAYLKLLNILENLRDLPASQLPKRNDGRPDVLGALELALDGETYQIKTEDDAGVQVFELREIRGLRFRHIYVLGLVNGQMPALPEEGILFRRRLNHPKLKAQLQQKEAEVQFLFSHVFEAAQEKLVLSRPMAEDDQPTLPSPFLTAVEDLIDLRKLEPDNLVTGIGEAAGILGRVGRSIQMGAASPTPSLSRIWPNLSVDSVSEMTPILTSLTTWQVRPAISNLAVDWPEMLQILFPDDHQFSPSQLETYAACPFRFFGMHMLRLEEREADPTRLHYGSLVHGVLHRFYKEKREDNGIAADEPLSATNRSDRERLVRLFNEEKSKLDKGILTPDLEMLFVSQGGVIDLILDVMESVEREEASFGNIATEFELEKVRLGKDVAGRPVFLAGKIDRVDGNRSDPQIRIIIDYKTGGVPDSVSVQIKIKEGRLLQLPLYAAALQIQENKLKVIGGAYVHLNERPKTEMIRAEKAILAVGKPLASRIAPDTWNPQAAVSLALDLAGKIRAGQFHLTKYGSSSDHPECSDFCPLRHACRHPEGYGSSRIR
jgi:ATP-dependent helicase/DNAse subunit B